MRSENYSCGTSTSPRTCSRTVTDTRTVIDGSCERELGVVFEPGRSYLFQLNYQDGRNCSLQCMIQEPIGDGKFKNEPCVTYTVDD